MSSNGITPADFEMDVAAFSDYDSEKEDELANEKNYDSDDDVIMDLRYLTDVTLGFDSVHKNLQHLRLWHII